VLHRVARKLGKSKNIGKPTSLWTLVSISDKSRRGTSIDATCCQLSSAGSCAPAPAADVDRKAAAVDGTNRRTDRRTPDRCIDSAPLEADRFNNFTYTVCVGVHAVPQ